MDERPLCGRADGFAEAREKTNNGITQLELDKFLKPYSRQTVETCHMLLENRRKQEAFELMELWHRLLPEDAQIKENWYLSRVSVARTRDEMEALVGEMLERIEKEQASPDEKEGEAENIAIYKAGLTRAWERLGYPAELAALRTEILFTEETGELEWLAEKVKDCQIRKDKLAEVYKVSGDARRKQGQTAQAFADYKKAMEYAGERSYVKKELSRIFLTDLYKGNQKACTYTAKTDAGEYLDMWLGKYGSLEEIREFVKKLL